MVMTNEIDNNSNSAVPPEYLFGKIMSRIEAEKRLIAIRRKIFVFAGAIILSLIAMVPSVGAFSQNMGQSNFIQFVSLIFSDGRSILLYWNSFSLALLESLPVISLTIVLSLVFILLASFRFLVKNIEKFNSFKLTPYGAK